MSGSQSSASIRRRTGREPHNPRRWPTRAPDSGCFCVTSPGIVDRMPPAIVRPRPHRPSPRRPDLPAGAWAPHHARAPARTFRRRYVRHRGGRDARVSRNGDHVRPVPLLRPARGDRARASAADLAPGDGGPRGRLPRRARVVRLYLDDGGRLLGSLQDGPSRLFPRAADLPGGPVSDDAVLVTCSYLLGDGAEWVEKSLLLRRDRGVPRPRGRCGGGVRVPLPRRASRSRSGSSSTEPCSHATSSRSSASRPFASRARRALPARARRARAGRGRDGRPRAARRPGGLHAADAGARAAAVSVRVVSRRDARDSGL